MAMDALGTPNSGSAEYRFRAIDQPRSAEAVRMRRATKPFARTLISSGPGFLFLFLSLIAPSSASGPEPASRPHPTRRMPPSTLAPRGPMPSRPPSSIPDPHPTLPPSPPKPSRRNATLPREPTSRVSRQDALPAVPPPPHPTLSLTVSALPPPCPARPSGTGRHGQSTGRTRIGKTRISLIRRGVEFVTAENRSACHLPVRQADIGRGGMRWPGSCGS